VATVRLAKGESVRKGISRRNPQIIAKQKAPAGRAARSRAGTIPPLSPRVTQSDGDTVKKFALALVLSAVATCAFAAPLTAEDYFEIQQLYSKYNHAIDSGNADAYADTFTPDGVFNNNAGREALKKFINETWVGQMKGATRQHWNTNLLITGDSQAAKGSVYLMLVDLSTKPVSVMAMALYDDELVKTPQGWRFTKRQTKRAGPPAAPAAAPSKQ
jgi:uncharacterized protein (TIGR02246 family)